MYYSQIYISHVPVVLFSPKRWCSRAFAYSLLLSLFPFNKPVERPSQEILGINPCKKSGTSYFFNSRSMTINVIIIIIIAVVLLCA